MPVEQASRGQWLLVVLGRIQHHFDDALDVAVCRRQPADFDSEPACDRGTHLVPVELFPLDLARFEDVLGKSLQYSLRFKLETETLHAPDQAPLPVPNLSQTPGDALGIPAKARPSRPIVDVRAAF